MAEERSVPTPGSFEEPYRVARLRRPTSVIAELELAPLHGELDYQAGEYVLLEDERGEVPPRSYSVANAPRPDRTISLLVTRVPDGETSRWVHDRLREGDTVTLSGPYGTFVDHPASTAPALYLAAGSGLAPIRALVEAGLRSRARRSLTLIFSARTEADVIDRERFERLQRDQPSFRFIRTLTRGPGQPPHGRIPALLPGLYESLADRDVFIAGAPAFVLACAAAAGALGARRERIYTEEFFVEPQPWTDEPRETGERM